VRKAFVLGAAAMMCVALIGTGQAAQRPLYPPGATVGGTDYPGWLGDYATWIQELPAEGHPFFDPASPDSCSSQPGGVLFMVGSDCTVAEGTPVFISPAWYECSTAEGNGETFPELRGCAKEGFDADFGPSSLRRLRLNVDGVGVRHVRRWTFVSPGEVVDLPDDNLWDAPPGPTKSVTKGFVFMLRPLASGRHRLVFAGRFVFDGQAYPFHTPLTLHVEGYA
jgi:hypothetical protein